MTTPIGLTPTNPSLGNPASIQFGKRPGRRSAATLALLAALGLGATACGESSDAHDDAAACADQLRTQVSDSFERQGLQRAFIEGHCDGGEFDHDVVISMPEDNPRWRDDRRAARSDNKFAECAEDVADFRRMAEDRGLPRVVIRGECDDEGKGKFEADQLVLFPTPQGSELNIESFPEDSDQRYSACIRQAAQLRQDLDAQGLVNTLARGRCDGDGADDDFQLDELIGMPEPTGWEESGVSNKDTVEGTYAECALDLRIDRERQEDQGMPNILIRGACDDDNDFNVESFREFEYTNTSGAQVTQEGSAVSERTGDYVQFMSDDNLFRMAQWMVYDPQNPEASETSGVYFVYYPVNRTYYSYGGVY